MTSQAKEKTRFSGTVAIYSITLLVSAALMFALQPMVGKMLLPLAGGTPAGWIVAMAFFQVMLLVGYYFAHFLSRFEPRLHGLIYIGALCLGAFFLPIHLSQQSYSSTLSPMDIFRLLTVAVAVPFVALSTTSSTIQRLFGATTDESARDPYFLYAASNLGSFAGLLLYPVIAEPLLGLSNQSQFWFCGYLLLIFAALLCVIVVHKSGVVKAAKEPSKTTGDNMSRIKWQWILLAFLPSSLMMGVTTHISTDIVSAPMIWVLPLAAYLLTFVVAFAKRQIIRTETVESIHSLIVTIAIIALFLLRGSHLGSSWSVACLHVMAFGFTALMCHMQLAKIRPVDRPEELTSFYLMISIGGALGGLLNAFIIPLVLDRIIEYPAMLILSLGLNPLFNTRRITGKTIELTIIAIALVLISTFLGKAYVSPDTDKEFQAIIAAIKILAMCLVLFIALVPRAAFYACIVMIFTMEIVTPHHVISMTRNFYGVIKISENPAILDGVTHTARYMTHGTTVHGMQMQGSKLEKEPTTYYTKKGPAGDVINSLNPRDVVVIGLGAGSLNCYESPVRKFTFIEIDPDVVKMAENQFTFLSGCKNKTPPRLIVGDGRLELEKLKGERFDLIVLDAFSSDGIPVHLLTVDAIKGYLDRLKPRGAILFNISNRYFDLAPVLDANAAENNLVTRSRLNIADAKSTPYETDSRWLVMTHKDVSLANINAAKGWEKLPATAGTVKPWTDDYTNLLGSLSALKKPYIKAKTKAH